MRGTHRVIRQSDFQTIFLGIPEHARCSSRELGFKDSPHALGIAQRAYLANVVQTVRIAIHWFNDDDVKTHCRVLVRVSLCRRVPRFFGELSTIYAPMSNNPSWPTCVR